MPNSSIFLITGEIQTGKTTRLLNWAATNTAIAGLLTPVAADGKRRFYDVVNRSFFDMEAKAGEQALAVGRFSFSASAFEKANLLLQTYLQQPHWKYLLIDEIGPLELKQELGFYPTLQYLLTAAHLPCNIAIVVRAQCCTALATLFALHHKRVEIVSAAAFATAHWEQTIPKYTRDSKNQT
jgi:nucleoside-triphosphatase THEP1